MVRFTKKVLRAFVLTNRLFGYLPYSFDTAGHCVPSAAWLTYCAVSRAGFNLLFFFVIAFDGESEHTGQTAFIIWLCILAVNMIVQYWAHWTRIYPRMRAVINSESVRNGAPFVSLRFLAFTLWFTALNVPMGIAFAVSGVFWTPLAICFLSVPWAVAFVQHWLPIITLSVFLHCLAERFRMLNKKFSKLKWAGNQANILEMNNKNNIGDIRRKHRSATAVVNELAFCFGPCVVAEGISDFWLTVYLLYKMLVSQTDSVAWMYDLSLVVCVFARWLYLFTTASRVSSLGNKSLSICSGIIEDRIIALEERQEVQLFLDMLAREPVRILLLGEVNLNISLLFEVTASGIGYVVILLQFKSTESQ